MCWNVSAVEKFKGGALQMIRPYASSLQSLEICVVRLGGSTKTDWALFREFRQLSSIKLAKLWFGVDQDFYAALNCLNLTHLCFDQCQFPTDFAKKMAGVTSFVSLRSLWFQSYADDIYEMFVAMPQLTSLRMQSLDFIESLLFLTALRVLEFSRGVQALSNLSNTFSHVSTLESLAIKGNSPCKFSSSCISHLTNLKSLSLEAFSLDRHIFHALAQLSGLTKLCLYDCRIRSFYALSGINTLTSLKRLHLDGLECPVDAATVLQEGKLFRLRYLSFTSNTADQFTGWSNLFRRLPSLRRCSVHDSVHGFTVDGFDGLIWL